MTNAVEIRHLSKSIEGSPILHDICMNVKQGEVYGFLGANGAGKTSLMKTLYHIIFPDTGTVCLLGETINKGNNPVFSRIGSIIESPVFYSHLSAYENMELHCRYMGAGYENIMETLSLLGIAETGNKAVGKFSFGNETAACACKGNAHKAGFAHFRRTYKRLRPTGNYRSAGAAAANQP